jgi:hypothetical protein
MVTGLDVGAGQPGERVGEGVGREEEEQEEEEQGCCCYCCDFHWNLIIGYGKLQGIGSGERFNYYSKIREWGNIKLLKKFSEFEHL